MRIFGILSLLLVCMAMVRPGEKQVKAALEQNSSRAIASYFDEHVSMTIGDKAGVYSQIQAEHILRDFFARHPNLVYNQQHSACQGHAKHYTMGSYTSDKHAFSVTYLCEVNEGRTIVRTLTIQNK